VAHKVSKYKDRHPIFTAPH